MTYLTHAEAAKAKAEGKEVESRDHAFMTWRPFVWDDLNHHDIEFRLKSATPRVAREWWVTLHPLGRHHNNDLAHREPIVDAIHVREILPGEITVREALEIAHGRLHAMNLRQAAGVIFDLKYELCGDDK